jgi:hypothetical protein
MHNRDWRKYVRPTAYERRFYRAINVTRELVRGLDPNDRRHREILKVIAQGLFKKEVIDGGPNGDEFPPSDRSR